MIMLFGFLMLFSGIIGTVAVYNIRAIRRAEKMHAGYVREWQRANAPKTTCIVRTRHRRAARREAPAPLPLDELNTQLIATGQARCVRIGGVYR